LKIQSPPKDRAALAEAQQPVIELPAEDHSSRQDREDQTERRRAHTEVIHENGGRAGDEHEQSSEGQRAGKRISAKLRLAQHVAERAQYRAEAQRDASVWGVGARESTRDE